MQTAKARPNALEIPSKSSRTTTRAARQLNLSGSDLESASSSPNNATGKPKGKTPKAVDRSSRRNSAPELVRLQEELRNVKNQLNHSDLEKSRVQAEAAEARQQLVVVSNQLSETQRKFLDLSDSEDARFQELRKIAQERDKAWQSELGAVQKQKSLDSAALSSAMNEIKKLKLQLERVAESEAAQFKHAESAYHELRNIREELSETLVLVENLKTELCECRDSEAQALEMVGNTQMLLDIANATAETLHSETMKAREALDAVYSELEQSRAREVALEAMVRDLQEELDRRQSDGYHNANNFVDSESGQLKFALETSEIRYYEHHLPAEAEVSKHSRLMPQTNSGNAPVPRTNMEEFQAVSTDDSEEVRRLTKENEQLRENLRKQEMEIKKAGKEAVALLDAARSAEEEALTKLVDVMEEADKNGERAAQAARQLEMAQAANSEMEAELRRLKVQLDQWRKAAEAAAAMLSGTNERKVAEIGGAVEYSRFSLDDDDDDGDGDGDGSPKRRNGNVLKKIGGVLWKKGQK